MVRLTAEYIARCNGHTKRKRDEPTTHYLKRITHLYMAERNIEAIENLSQCQNLTVLYLYDNKLNKTMNLGTAQNLTHLYLQNNNISKIEGLKHLQKLTKLYLGYNNLLVIEGLQSLELLRELNVEYQRLPPGEKLLFEPRTLVGLRNCLQCLNVSGNHMDSLKELEVLSELSQFQASDNAITEFSNTQGALLRWQKLLKLDLTGNPICHKAKYRDKIIVMSQSIESLDGREISRLERQFLMSWKASREARRRQRMESQKNEFGDDFMDLPPLHQHPPAPTPPPHYMMGGLPGGRKRFEAILAKSKSLPNSAAVKQLLQKQKAPYTTPRMTSTLMDSGIPPESELLGNKSISDLTDRRRSERQMTPHPGMNQRSRANGAPPKAPMASPIYTNGNKPDFMGSGDVMKTLKSPPLPNTNGNVSDIKDYHRGGHPSLRGSKVNTKPPFYGAILSDKFLPGKTVHDVTVDDVTRTPQKIASNGNGRESFHDDSLLIVSNGNSKDKEVINGSKDE